MINQKGQSFIELLITLPLFIALVGGSLFTSLYIFKYFQLRLAVEAALICTYNGRSQSDCETELSNKAQSYISFGEIEKIILIKKTNKLTAAASLQLVEGLRINEVQELNLPLFDLASFEAKR